MIAFYVLSNLTLINAAVIKMAYFPEERAELIIRANLPQLSGELVQAYLESGIFCAAHPIPYPSHLRPENGKFGKIPGVRKITFFWDHYRYCEKILAQTVGKHKYDRFIVPYLGNMVEYVAVYLAKCNPDIQIAFCEEGTTQARPLQQILSHLDVGKRTWKDILADKIGEEYFLRKARRYAVQDMYLHIPDSKVVDPWFENRRKLPPAFDYPISMRPLEEMSGRLNNEKVTAYNSHMAVFVTGYCDPMSIVRLENCQAMGEELPLFLTTCQELGVEDVILKPHPGSKVALEHLGKNMEESGLYVDRDKYLFETMFIATKSLEDIILICRYSGMPLNIKFWINKEPYFIYTYRLFPSYIANQDYAIEGFIEEMKTVYQHPERIMVPNSLREYCEMLHSVKEKILDKRYHYNRKDQFSEGESFA